MTFIVFHYYTHEPIMHQQAPETEGLPTGTFAYHKGNWLRVIYLVTPKSPLARGVKVWEHISEHQVPKTIRLNVLLLK